MKKFEIEEIARGEGVAHNPICSNSICLGCIKMEIANNVLSDELQELKT